MTDTEYAEWIKFHRGVFQMKATDDLPMFAAWQGSMVEFSLTEARAASICIAADIETCGKFRTEHLGLIRSKIQSARYEQMRAEIADAESRMRGQQCRTCDGSGYLSVPNPVCILDGSWRHPFYGMAVSCECNRGVVKFNAVNEALREGAAARHMRPASKLMGLAEYEFTYPDWRLMIEDRNTQRESERKAKYHAMRADSEQPIDAEDVRKIAQQIGGRK